MHVQDLKRWHWIAISVVVGLLLSFVWSSVEWDENLPTIGQRDFEAGLVGARDRFGNGHNGARHLCDLHVCPFPRVR